jgi:uncharacterized protein YjbI with pentapeptide repeats
MTKIPQDVDDLPFAHALDPGPSPLSRDTDYDLCHFDGTTERDGDVGSSRFTECAFENVQFEELRLRRTKFTDVWWRGARVLTADFAESEWLDATVLSSAFAGVQAFETQLRRVVFQRCKLDAVNLRGAHLQEVVFEDCILRDIDFTGARMLEVAFPGSALRSSKFAKSKLAKVDFRDATVLEVVDGYQNLRGGIVDSSQAVELSADLAGALGISVQDR